MNVDSEACQGVQGAHKMNLGTSKNVFLEAMPARRGSEGAALVKARSK